MLRPSLLRSCRRVSRSVLRRGDTVVSPSLRNSVVIQQTKRELSGFTAFTATDPETLYTQQADVTNESHLAARVAALTRAFQVSGHHLADLDPLKIGNADLSQTVPKELDLSNYKFSDADLDRKDIDFGVDLLTGFLSSSQPKPFTLRELITCLQRTYCGNIGVEYMHMNNMQHANWIRERVELREAKQYSKDEKLQIWRRLAYSDMFETFLSNKFPQAKRFGLEGCESMIGGLKALIDTSASLGVESFVTGMAHRGRLNVLANVMRKPLELIMAEFGGGLDIGDAGSGDVKYHLGMSTKRVLPTGKEVELSLLPNPSHLETVNPVVAGKTRAKQFYSNDTTMDKNMSIVVHGDAAFAGQGVVYETIGFSDLHDYTTGGTIHIIINNQIGFTTNPRSSRSSPYATDLAKFISAPIFHVNGDNPEAVVFVCQLAAEWRQKFKKDIVIDIICYRRRGHNELDQPMFTQPKMYKAIDKHPTTFKLYTDRMIEEGVFKNQEEANAALSEVRKVYEEAFARAKDVSKGATKREDATGDSVEILKIMNREWSKKEEPWTNMDQKQFSQIRDTGLSAETLKQLGEKLNDVPQGFNIHPGVKKTYDLRKQMILKDGEVDWGCAELLAYASLLNEKFHVRLSGQDVERGTFSHRHCVLVDQESEAKHIPLQHLNKDQAKFSVSNSHLSEYGVLGFELGYSYESPNALVIWEAQFGDFANGAQIIIDQYLASAEQKWLRSSGLVMLLPHGYEGQGPEHSNARLERFLQLNDERPDIIPDMKHETRRQIQQNNWQIVNCTTPANYFHVLRRQLHRSFRKPLVVFTPKSLLRAQKVKIQRENREFKIAVSPIEDMLGSNRFKRVIGENPVEEKEFLAKNEDIKRVVFCTGKVYYDLWKIRRENNIKNVAIIRVEQIAPFPFDKVEEELRKYPNAQVAWCQEEPRNYGAFVYFYFRTRTILKKLQKEGGSRKEVTYYGRKQAASPATGFGHVHAKEQEELCTKALTL